MPQAGPITQGPLRVGDAFGPRYHILRILGSGGMGTVYQAWDNELGIALALKVIRPEVLHDRTVADDVERRFKRELLLARQVTHKNVVRIHDLGDINGIRYITMPCIDGADLSTILKRAGRLPVGRALALSRQIVAGLVARTRWASSIAKTREHHGRQRRSGADHGFRHRPPRRARRPQPPSPMGSLAILITWRPSRHEANTPIIVPTSTHSA
jgi:serine/threonine protein kinase